LTLTRVLSAALAQMFAQAALFLKANSAQRILHNKGSHTGAFLFVESFS
jgi:hypothetical protein